MYVQPIRSAYRCRRCCFGNPMRRFSVLLITFIVGMGCENPATISLSSRSPDGKAKVKIIENPRNLDRNYSIAVYEGTSNWICFMSPDELRPPSEHIFWSSDSSAFCVVSKSGLVDPSIDIGNSFYLYMLYDIKERRIWCNSTQTNLPHFTLKHLQKYHIYPTATNYKSL
jgi:hypothetical protein